MKILREELLNFASLEGNNNKFYKIQLLEIDSNHFDVYAEYGRLGSLSPQSTRKPFVHVDLANKHFDKTLSSKIKKGYQHVLTSDKDDNDGVNNTKDSKLKNELEDKIYQLIGRLYGYSKSYVKKSITTPLGNLSKKQVDKGRKVLEEIEIILNSGVPSDKYLKLSNEFYALIPFVFGHKVDIAKLLIDSFEKLNERLELLDVMESLVNTNLNSDAEQQYKDLGIKLKHLDSSDTKRKELIDNVEKSKSNNHHFGFNIQNVYEVEYMKNPPEFNPLNVEVMELYHGSRSENIIHILQSGLKIKPASAVHTGSMFGSGIYFANQSSKSANYCWGFGSKDRNRCYYLLVCEVAVGKMKEFSDAQPHLTSAPWGYNSVKGVKGRSLVHDEIIVYKESQVRIKYILEFKSS